MLPQRLSWQFDTSNHTLGLHDIKAVAYKYSWAKDSSLSQRSFVEFPMTFVMGIIALVVVVSIVSIVAGIFVARKREAKEKLEKSRRRI